MTPRSKMFQSICSFRSTRQQKWHDFLMMGKENGRKLVKSKQVHICFPNRSEPIGLDLTPNTTTIYFIVKSFHSSSFSSSNFSIKNKWDYSSIYRFLHEFVSFSNLVSLFVLEFSFGLKEIDKILWTIFFFFFVIFHSFPSSLLIDLVFVILWKEEMVIMCCINLSTDLKSQTLCRRKYHQILHLKWV